MEIDNFRLSEEQEMILETVRRFVKDQIEPNALQWDEHCTFAAESLSGLAELGMLGIPLPEASGGAELGLVSFAVALEEIARVCGSSARLLLSQTGLCGMALQGHAAAESIATGERLGAFVGPDSAITATPSGDGLSLSGTAPMVTAAQQADCVVVIATGPDDGRSICLVDAAAVQREPVPALGFRASAPGRITFADTAVAADSIVARGADADSALERIHIAACVGGGAIGVGLATGSRRLAAAHAEERVAFGKPLARQQAVALKLGDCYRATQAARHLVYDAARRADAALSPRPAANMARLAGIEAALQAADEAIQILGGYGFVAEYHVERFYRDAKTLEVFGGGHEPLRRELAKL